MMFKLDIIIEYRQLQPLGGIQGTRFKALMAE